MSPHLSRAIDAASPAYLGALAAKLLAPLTLLVAPHNRHLRALRAALRARYAALIRPGLPDGPF